MVAKREEITRYEYNTYNGKPVLEIVVKKYRRNFQGKYIDYMIVYSAYGNIAKKWHNKIKVGDIVKINYRIESKEWSGKFYTTLIVEDIKLINSEPKIVFEDNKNVDEFLKGAEDIF